MQIEWNVLSSIRFKKILDSLMYELGAIAQSLVNEKNLIDKKSKAAAYIEIITSLVNGSSKMMINLNKLGIERIKKEYKIESKEDLQNNSIFII